MDQGDLERMLQKYNNPFSRISPDVAADFRQLLEHLRAQNRLILAHRKAEETHRAEMQGAQQTMMALTKAIGGRIEIPFALIDTLNPQDALWVEDAETPFGTMKRFEYRPHPPTMH